MKSLPLASAAVLLAALSTTAAPTVTQVTVSQSNSQTVRVNYTIDEAAVITLDILTNATADAWASIGVENIFRTWGDVGVLVPAGSHTIYWAPEKSWIEAHPKTYDVKAAVKAWAVTAPPDYMVVDLRSDDLRAGAPKIRYFETAAQVPDGVTDRKYKTDFLLMRKIPAKGMTFRMGSPSSENGRAAALTGAPDGAWNNDAGWNQETAQHVTLTNDFYLGVDEYTRKQCITWSGYSYGNSGSMSGGKEALPIGGDNGAGWCDFADFRGTTYLWPENGHQVTSDSALGKLRAKTGIDFDLPTEAQWEFACHAGVPNALYSGHELDAVTSSSDGRNEYVDELAWHKGNSGQSVQEVGQKKPNGFGLYDMLGNVGEFVLDRHTGDLGSGAVTEPIGATSGGTRVVKGGCVTRPAFWCRAAFRQNYVGADTRGKELGFRLWAPAIAK